MAHTKGPWELCDRGDYSDFGGNSRVILGDDRRIAVVQTRGEKECEDNARLIAAAPELLEALQDMYDSACTNPTSTPKKSAFLKAIAAINKARGES